MLHFDLLYLLLVAAVFAPIVTIGGVCLAVELRNRADARAATLANLRRGLVPASLGSDDRATVRG